jgi:hypothetical protein
LGAIGSNTSLDGYQEKSLSLGGSKLGKYGKSFPPY